MSRSTAALLGARRSRICPPGRLGRVTLHAVDVGPIGAEGRLNGAIVVTLPPPMGRTPPDKKSCRREVGDRLTPMPHGTLATQGPGRV